MDYPYGAYMKYLFKRDAPLTTTRDVLHAKIKC